MNNEKDIGTLIAQMMTAIIFGLAIGMKCELDAIKERIEMCLPAENNVGTSQ